MTAATHVAFYVELLESRLRFLDRQLAKIGRFDAAFEQLTKERDDVENELAGIVDVARPRVPR